MNYQRTKMKRQQSPKRDSNRSTVVEDSGVEPLTSCLQGKLTILTDKILLSIKSVETKGLLRIQ